MRRAKLSAFVGRRCVEDIVADPEFEQVAEDEDRVGLVAVTSTKCSKAATVLGIASLRCRSEMETAGARWSPRPLFAHRSRSRRSCSRDQTTTAFSITTSSTGTSWWKPFEPVFTFLILSTTSMPSTTLPNTA